MKGSAILLKISDVSAKAAGVYPQIVRLMDASCIRPEDRLAVLMYVMQVIDTDAVPGPCLQ